MRQSQLFTKTRKEAPKDEISLNAQLLIRGGFIDKLSAGVYTYLPLGLRVFKKIEDVVRDEMNKVGGQEILMPSLVPKEYWEKTGRWETLDVLFKLKGGDEKEYALGSTHEEVISPLVKKFVFSYKELPQYVYQFQNKFRNELRAKSGIMRGREFVMKDLYSFHTSEDDLNDYYEKQKQAYKNIFNRCGLGDITYVTYASGGSFSKYSHEFQTLTKSGEDIIYVCQKCKIAVNKEIIDDQDRKCPECGNVNLREEKAVETGNIFKLQNKYSDPFDFKYTDENGEQKPVLMGCYGIGLGRLMGTVSEVHNDEKGIIWPEEVAPFKVHLLVLGDNEEVRDKADKLYKDLIEKGVEVLYDDREEASIGEKFADADLIGIPTRVVVSEKSLKVGGVEIKKRNESDLKIVDEANLVSEVK